VPRPASSNAASPSDRAAAPGGASAEVRSVERCLEALFRLNASRKVHARQAEAAGVALSRPGFSLLRRVHDHGPISLGELAKLSEMDRAATGRQVRQLEREGLVRRAPAAGDARVVVVKETPQGARAHRMMSEVRHRHIADVLTAWSEEDRRGLAGLLARLVADLRSVHYRSAAGEEPQ
jgi:DNA-binding MarR family transcriptional regulator